MERDEFWATKRTVILRISDEELAEFKERWIYRSDADDN